MVSRPPSVDFSDLIVTDHTPFALFCWSHSEPGERLDSLTFAPVGGEVIYGLAVNGQGQVGLLWPPMIYPVVKVRSNDRGSVERVCVEGKGRVAGEVATEKCKAAGRMVRDGEVGRTPLAGFMRWSVESCVR